MQDDYEGDFTQRRVLLYTLRFTAKTYLFGPVQTATKDIIRKTAINYIAGGAKAVERDVTYTVVPRAVKDYTGDIATTLSEDMGLSDLTITVADGTALSTSSYYSIGDEEIYVKKITGNSIVVERAKDNTTQASHLRGEEIKAITSADTPYIELGDDFGFDGSFS